MMDLEQQIENVVAKRQEELVRKREQELSNLRQAIPHLRQVRDSVRALYALGFGGQVMDALRSHGAQMLEELETALLMPAPTVTLADIEMQAVAVPGGPIHGRHSRPNTRTNDS